MKKSSGLFWIIGLCSFVAFMCSGFAWLLGAVGISWGFLATLEMLAYLVLSIAAFFAGWVWLCSVKMNKTLKIVLKVLFIIFAVLSICGVIGLSF